jgi:hypothetical protein
LRRPHKLLPIIPLKQCPLILLLPLLDLEREILLQEIHRLEIQISAISRHDRLRVTARTPHHLLILQCNDTPNTEDRAAATQAHGPPSHSQAYGTCPVFELRHDSEDFGRELCLQVAGDRVGEAVADVVPCACE